MNLNKRISIVFITTLITLTSVTGVFAQVSNTKLEYLKQLSDTVQKNINEISLYDTNSGNKWEMNIDGSLVEERDEAMKFLQGVYSVVPFYNSMTIKSSNGDYKISLENLSAYENKMVVEVAKNWLKDIITDDMNNEQKVKAIHDKIINETSYDDVEKNEVHSPAGVAIEKKAVCDGYSRMFGIMLILEDIPVVQVTSGVMDHAFNLVYINEKWLLVDVTYNDPLVEGKQVLRYDYFLIDPKTSKKHKYDPSDKGLELDDYIKIGNYIYSDKIYKKKIS